MRLFGLCDGSKILNVRCECNRVWMLLFASNSCMASLRVFLIILDVLILLSGNTQMVFVIWLMAELV